MKVSFFPLITAAALAGGSAHAAVIGQLGILDSSTGLNPGDQYRLIFVTSGNATATSTDITTYNSFVQSEAAGAGLGGVTWSVVGSTEAVDARDNTGTNPTVSVGVPVFLMDGTTQFAANNADLWDGANVGVQFDQNGANYTGGRIFTGSDASGVEEAGDPQFLGRVAGVRTGGATNTGGLWMRIFTDSPDSAQSFYAMSEPLTVVPEPSSFSLLGLGTLALLRRRRK